MTTLIEALYGSHGAPADKKRVDPSIPRPKKLGHLVKERGQQREPGKGSLKHDDSTAVAWEEASL